MLSISAAALADTSGGSLTLPRSPASMPRRRCSRKRVIRCTPTAFGPGRLNWSKETWPRTLPRRLATLVLPGLPGKVGSRLHARLMAGGMYGDERWIAERLAAGFEIETLERYRSDVHLHGRCV